METQSTLPAGAIDFSGFKNNPLPMIHVLCAADFGDVETKIAQCHHPVHCSVAVGSGAVNNEAWIKGEVPSPLIEDSG
jgi:hypothetical protein